MSDRRNLSILRPVTPCLGRERRAPCDPARSGARPPFNPPCAPHSCAASRRAAVLLQLHAIPSTRAPRRRVTGSGHDQELTLMAEAKHTSGTIKVEFDPTMPAGSRYVGPSEDGPVYEEMSLTEAVIERAAQILAEGVRKDEGSAKRLAERMNDRIEALLANEVPALVEKALSEPLVVTDRWGKTTAEGTIRDLVVTYMQQQLTVKTDGYGYGKTALGKVVADEIDRRIQGDMSAAVKAAKAEITKRLQAQAAGVLVKAIADGLR